MKSLFSRFKSRDIKDDKDTLPNLKARNGTNGSTPSSSRSSTRHSVAFPLDTSRRISTPSSPLASTPSSAHPSPILRPALSNTASANSIVSHRAIQDDNTAGGWPGLRPSSAHGHPSGRASGSELGLSGLGYVSGSQLGLLDDVPVRDRSLSHSHIPTARGDGGKGSEDTLEVGRGKKVTFRSPAPTPTTSVWLDNAAAPPAVPAKSDRASSGAARTRSPSPTKAPNGTASQPAGQTRNSSRQSLSTKPPKSTLPPLSGLATAFSGGSSRIYTSSSGGTKIPSPTKSPSRNSSRTFSTGTNGDPRSTAEAGRGNADYGGFLTSPTPSDLSSHSTRSYLAQPQSWSEMAEEELIANLGPRERTRQEVLWEIVSSEERYVQDLVKLNETFCRSLLAPSAQSPSLTLHDPMMELSRTLSPASIRTPPTPDEDRFDDLPIARRYASAQLHSQRPSQDSTASDKSDPSSINRYDVAGTRDVPTSAASTGLTQNPRLNAYQKLTNGRPGGSGLGIKGKPSQTSMSDRARSHQSLPAPPRGTGSSSAMSPSTSAASQPSWSGSFARMSYQPHPNRAGSDAVGARGKGKARDGRSMSGDSLSSFRSRELELPEDLEKTLKVLGGGILEGHLRLAAALRRRYEDQYPLVRSLADVFTAHSYILKEYAIYVLSLESALSTIDTALSLAAAPAPRRLSRHPTEPSPLLTLGKTLLALDEIASERGESGLSISLSKPFQRLLKYPLLFQNLLFNTDPSLREYEATLGMVDEVEVIVRGIEDEKGSQEEREATRDVWARIEGLEGDKGLMVPRPNRLLVSETQIPPDQAKMIEDVIRNKKSRHRLSDMLKKQDQLEYWIIRFSDVSLLCEKTGNTNLPMSNTVKRAGRGSGDEANGRSSKYATTGRRAQSIRSRNLYKFVKVHGWHLKPKSSSTEALLSMEDISRARVDSARELAGLASLDAQAGDQPTNTKIDASAPTSPPRPVTLTSPGRTLGQTPSQTPTRIPLKTQDGPSPSRTVRSTRSGRSDTDTLASDRLSVMSFAFKGGDQVRPVRMRPKGITTSTPPSPLTTASGGGGVTKATLSSQQKRSSAGHMSGRAADAKFAHRLRSTEMSDSDATVRPRSIARRSLPPAMLLQSRAGAGGSGGGGTAGIGGGTKSTPSPLPLSPKTNAYNIDRSAAAGGGTMSPKTPTSAVHSAGAEGRAGSVSSRRVAPKPWVEVRYEWPGGRRECWGEY